MILSEKKIFWACLLTTFVASIHILHDILSPFIIALILSYFLNPIVGFLERYKIPRFFGTFIVMSMFCFVITYISLKLIPAISDQVSQFIINIPTYKTFLQNKTSLLISSKITNLEPNFANKIQDFFHNFSGEFFKYVLDIISNIWDSGLAIINIMSLVFVTPILTFYLLKDWNLLTSKLNNVVPIKSKKTIHIIIDKIDNALSGFIRGQTNVCIILSFYYSLSLYLLGLNYSLFIGIASGFLLFIPYIGIFSAAFIALIMAFIQFENLHQVLYIALIFLIGQIIEGNIITPKLVGKKIGLHPVWIFFALFAFGNLFGFVGILFAVPIAAIIGVLVTTMVDIYLKSDYYNR